MVIMISYGIESVQLPTSESFRFPRSLDSSLDITAAFALGSGTRLDIMWLALNYPYFLSEVTPTSISYAPVLPHKSECHRCLTKIMSLD